ncbi:MAG: hypothetical protein DI551_05265 [Micavibrio aeruginosavorus]|uniref:Uncharacterized protein n=1 Tax=Micavibrio aeruginosavorus TaxID=349221 RepID=A0A2W5N6E1_9BACT|nr:MAG: hypothetical protein DI551_05265 [Micavibrio aeruginosavorus]
MKDDFDDEDFYVDPTMHGLLLVIGHEALVSLSEKIGGRRLYIPNNPGINSPIVGYLGMENAKRLAECFPGRSFDIPIRPGRASLIAKLKAEGFTGPQIAEKMKIHLRTVRGHISRMDDENQLDFFG